MGKTRAFLKDEDEVPAEEEKFTVRRERGQ